MKPPRQVAAYLGRETKMSADDSDDNALVKMRTLKAVLAKIYHLIPNPGKNVGVSGSQEGPVWAALSERGALSVYATGPGKFSITSGLVNGDPILADSDAGDEISNAAPPEFTLSGNGYVVLWFKFTLDFGDDGYLESASDPVCYVKSETGEPEEDPATGLFALKLAKVTAGKIVDNWSPGRNLWAVACPDGRGTTEVATITITSI